MREHVVLHCFVDIDRGSRVRWVCAELGLSPMEKRLNYAGGEHRGDAFRRLNPFAKAPAVEIDGVPMFESGAICQYLAERHPEAGLTVEPGHPDRPRYLSWLHFALSTFDAAAFEVFSATILRPDAAQRIRAMERLAPLVDDLDRELGTRTHALGERFLLPDLFLGHALALLRMAQALDAARHPAVAAYLDRLGARPGARASGLFGPVNARFARGA